MLPVRPGAAIAAAIRLWLLPRIAIAHTECDSGPRDDREIRMIKVMKGFRVLEVAQFTFVPAAGAILADWGADVIKVEHPVRGDTQRGFINMGGVEVDPNRHPLIWPPTSRPWRTT